MGKWRKWKVEVGSGAVKAWWRWPCIDARRAGSGRRRPGAACHLHRPRAGARGHLHALRPHRQRAAGARLSGRRLVPGVAVPARADIEPVPDARRLCVQRRDEPSLALAHPLVARAPRSGCAGSASSSSSAMRCTFRSAGWPIWAMPPTSDGARSWPSTSCS